MKKILFTLSLSLIVILTKAQIQKGTMITGGSIGFLNSGGESKSGGVSVDDPKTNNLSFSPFGGYYISDKLALTMGLGYDLATSKSEIGNSETKFNSNLFSIIPGIRYNMPLAEKFGAFVQGSVQVGFGNTSNSTTSNGVKTTVDGSQFKFDIGLSPGILYFLKDNIAIEASYGRIGFNTTKLTTEAVGGDIENTKNNLDLGLNTRSLSFGFLYYINQ